MYTTFSKAEGTLCKGAENEEEHCKMLSPEHEVAIALLNSQWLLPAQDMHKTRPIDILPEMNDTLHSWGPTPPWEAKGNKSFFLMP